MSLLKQGSGRRNIQSEVISANGPWWFNSTNIIGNCNDHQGPQKYPMIIRSFHCETPWSGGGTEHAWIWAYMWGLGTWTTMVNRGSWPQSTQRRIRPSPGPLLSTRTATITSTGLQPLLNQTAITTLSKMVPGCTLWV